MFCDEEIINAYMGQPEYDADDANEDYFFDYYFDMTLHLTRKFRIVLETENYYVSMEGQNIFLVEKKGPIDSIAYDYEYLESFRHEDDNDEENSVFTEYEHTLFCGQKINSVRKNKESYTVEFSNFKLKVICYSEGKNIPHFYPSPYTRLLGTEHLMKKCACGGTAILETDIVSDYGVRCEKCNMGTAASMWPCDAIEEWNEEKQLLDVGASPKDTFASKCSYKSIEYIAIENESNRNFKFPVESKSIIVKVEDKFFEIESNYCGKGNYGFVVRELIDYNKKIWPYEIHSGNHRIIITNPDSFLETGKMVFDLGESLLFVTCNGIHLVIEKEKKQ